MINYYDIKIQLTSNSVKGQVYFRRLLKRQNTLIKALGVTKKFPRIL